MISYFAASDWCVCVCVCVEVELWLVRFGEVSGNACSLVGHLFETSELLLRPCP